MPVKKVGILGGGQLARMLALKAADLQLQVAILSLSSKDPAAQVVSDWIKGDSSCPHSLLKFLKKIRLLTFENEFIPAEKIQKTLQDLNKKIQIAPSLSLLAQLQDRLPQKQLLQKNKFKTSPFVPVSFSQNQQDNIKKLKLLLKKWGVFVLKKRIGGYDGYGTFIFKNQSHIKNFKSFDFSFIAEKWQPFKRELALISVRNKRGDVVFLPLVETKQKQARCFWVKGPVDHPQLSHLKKKISKFLTKIKYEGLIAFELFDIDGDLMINELAPRVHNSGHHSLDSLTEDQFSLHLKACLNRPLKTPQLKHKGFAMLNLLGVPRKPRLKNKDIHLHWYEKTTCHKGRKMGHLNTCGSSPSAALKKLLASTKTKA